MYILPDKNPVNSETENNTLQQEASASKTRNRYSSIERNAPASNVQEQNEVIPDGRSGGRSRSRQSAEEEVIHSFTMYITCQVNTSSIINVQL